MFPAQVSPTPKSPPPHKSTPASPPYREQNTKHHLPACTTYHAPHRPRSNPSSQTVNTGWIAHQPPPVHCPIQPSANSGAFPSSSHLNAIVQADAQTASPRDPKTQPSGQSQGSKPTLDAPASNTLQRPLDTPRSYPIQLPPAATSSNTHAQQRTHVTHYPPPSVHRSTLC